jgi:succinoglycan biosynthesis protein ExoW
MVKIGVIIPYFQRDPGILARALASVFRQELPAGAKVEVVVVDDESPAPAAPELDTLRPEHRALVTVLSQPNGGPGSARNRGLDHLVGTGADYVAFLDSDDIWGPRHLAEAVAALRRGFDFYFCANRKAHTDVEELDGGDMELARLRRPHEPQVTWLRPDASLIAVASERLLMAYLTAYVSQTSTIVVTMDAVRDLRFNSGLRGAGEDHLFWIELALAGHQAVISSAVNVTCGRGVNLYFSAFDFESVKVVERVGYLLLFWRHVKAKLRARGIARPDCEQGLTRYRRAYSYLFVRALLRRQVPPLKQLRVLMAEEPLLVLSMPFRFLSVLPHREREAPTW